MIQRRETRGWGIQMGNSIEIWLSSNSKVRAFGTYNVHGCRVSVPTPWNKHLFREFLTGYEDVEFVDLIEFGWPLQVGHFRLNLDASNKVQNQAGARCNPCQTKFSPRKGSEHLKAIMNFSYAHNETTINA